MIMENSDSEGEVDFEGWEEAEDENTEVKSLFCSNILPSVSALLKHDEDIFGFDMVKCCQAVGMDDISLIMLVNFIRTRVNENDNGDIKSEFAIALQAEICQHPEIVSDERYMVPVLQSDDTPDPLLYLLSEALSMPLNDDEEIFDKSGDKNVASQPNDQSSNDNNQSLKELQAELERYKALVSTLVTSDEGSSDNKTNKKDDKTESAVDLPNDEYYFDSYGQLSIHETMLRDKPRTTTYGAAMLENPEFFKGKTVLDVGCGTGILCMFAAKSGAKKVVGVDLSSIIERSKKVIDKNGYSDIITLVRGRLEETKLPLKQGEVDIIVSEWMGYGLYFENMLTSVLYAREKYLNLKNGVIMPSEASLHIEAMCARGEDDRVGYWSDVYGFDMLEMRDMLTKEAQVQYVNTNSIISQREHIHNLDIAVAKDEELDFEVPFSLQINSDGNTLHGVVISFDTLFGQGNLKIDNNNNNSSSSTTSFVEKVLSTGPAAPATHWKQTVLWFEMEKRIHVKKDAIIKGHLSYLRSKENQRDYDIILRWNDPNTGNEFIQTYVLAS